MAKLKMDYNFEESKDKSKIFTSYCNAFFTRLQSMFVYTGMPDTIPVQWLEEYLLKNGSCAITKIGNDLYALNGTAGGPLDIYYQPTRWVGANEGIASQLGLTNKASYDLEIGKECVYCKNDYNATGLMPMISRYCGLMTENYITTRIADINMRMSQIMSAPDDNTAQSARKYLDDIESGKLGVIGETAFFDGLKVQSSSVGSGDYMIQFIELQQYIKGSLYNELGLDANYNMKREALSKDEVALNDDALMPMIDDMLKERRDFCSSIEKLYGVHIEVDYGSSWHANSVEKIASLEDSMNANGDLSANMSDETSLNSDENANNSADNDLRDSITTSQLGDENGTVEESKESESVDTSTTKNDSTTNEEGDDPDETSKPKENGNEEDDSGDESSSKESDDGKSDDYEGTQDKKPDEDSKSDSDGKSDSEDKDKRKC